MKENSRDKLRDPDNWLKISVIGILTLVIAWKIITIPIRITNFDLNDLLFLVLVMFAIGLSAAFYFQAVRLNNNLNRSTLSFTKDMSEILGRIEAGLSQSRGNPGEGFTSMRDRFDGVPYNSVIIEQTEKTIKQEQKELEQKETERNDLIKDLLAKTSLQKEEQDSFFKTVIEKNDEINRLKQRINMLYNELEDLKSPPKKTGMKLTHISLGVRLRNYLRRGILDSNIISSSPPEEINEHFKSKLEMLDPIFIYSYMAHGYLNPRGNLTEKGLRVLISQNRDYNKLHKY
ncbi:MAG: hypothetical protein HPY50_14070 [Firmicutes bacterium]|nr:hypothetical protein [Bacillota bacterium]